MDPGFAERFARGWVEALEWVTVYYRSRQRGLSAEVFHFGPAGKVRAAFAHYDVRTS